MLRQWSGRRASTPLVLHRLEGGGHEDMRRFIAVWPRYRDALDHLPDMSVGLDQLRHELGRQVEARLAGEPHDVIVRQLLGHAAACHAGLAPVTPSSTTKVARRRVALSFCFSSSSDSKPIVQRAAVSSAVA